ncbi:MAG: MFS transporter [Ilumatobacteraceae bacterium]
MSSTFLSLRHRNVRLFLGGLAVSQVGAWVQFTAVAVLVDRLTESTTAIGVLTALQFGPLLVLGAWAGGVADRFDRRRIALGTQSAMALQATALAVAQFTGVMSLGVIYALTFVLGVVSAIDNPARRGFVTQLVEPSEISNVMALNTATMTGSRIFGPAIAALTLGPLGVGWLFVVNAASSAAIVGAIAAVARAGVREAPRAAPGGRPVRDAVAFIRRTPLFAPVFVVFTVVSTFGYNHNVSLPRIATDVWGSELWFGWVMTVTSIGSLAGSLLTASRTRVTLRWMSGHALLLGAAGLALAFAGHPVLALFIAVPLGLGGAAFIASMNSWSQEVCPPEMRGRILAFVAIAFLGSYPIGGPITGLIGDLVGLSWSLAYGAVIVIGATSWLRRRIAADGSMRHAEPVASTLSP